MSDAFTNALQAFSTVDNAFNRKRELDRQDRIDSENISRSRAADTRAAESHAQDTKIKQRTIDQQQELDDANYFGSQIKRLTETMEKSNMDPSPAQDQDAANTANATDPYNKLVDQLWSDKRFQDIATNRPWAQDLLSKATARVETYNSFGNQLSEIVNRGDEFVQQGYLRGDGNHQELVGPPAQQLFDNIARQRELSGESFPATIKRDSIRFVSPADGHGWVLEFKYENDKGQPVTGVATVNRTRAGEPGAENDPVIRKTIPDLLAESRQKRDANVALALLQARAAAGDVKAAGELVDIDKENRQQSLDEKKRQVVIGTMKGMAPDASVSDITRALVGNGVAAKEAKDIASALVKEPKESKLEWRGMKGKPNQEQAYKDGVAVPDSEGGVRLRWQPHAPKEDKRERLTEKESRADIDKSVADYHKQAGDYDKRLREAKASGNADIYPDLEAERSQLEQKALTITEKMRQHEVDFKRSYTPTAVRTSASKPAATQPRGMQTKPAAVVQPAIQAGKSASAAMYAVNPQTKQRIVSYDQGRSWRPAQ